MGEVWWEAVCEGSHEGWQAPGTKGRFYAVGAAIVVWDVNPLGHLAANYLLVVWFCSAVFSMYILFLFITDSLISFAQCSFLFIETVSPDTMMFFLNLTHVCACVRACVRACDK